jgi:hypothetical protein
MSVPAGRGLEHLVELVLLASIVPEASNGGGSW